jgi:DNA primase
MSGAEQPSLGRGRSDGTPTGGGSGGSRARGVPITREQRLAVGVAAEVKTRLTVLDVVGETVQLKKAGTTYKGLCPFHSEKTPSFIVTPVRESWHCFGCGEGGDIFSFVMRRDGLAFPEALRILASRAGVEIDERTSREDARRKHLHGVVESAIAFYHAVLTRSPSGERALAYLRGRGFTDETIEWAQLGWAPPDWDALGRTLEKRRQIGAAELAEVGLATLRKGGNGAYDRFRARVIFPIRDATGNATGLGGRILKGADGTDPEGPKYLNSPATPLFDKSRTLYLLDRAKTPIRKTGTAVIVEGYTDALMAHQAGFTNVVASLGTALTPGQVALLIRYAAKKIVLAYDVDPAGEKAGTLGVTSLEGLTRQLAAGDTEVELDEVRVARLPDGKDPDETIRESPDAWREAIRTALPIVEYLIDFHARGADLRTTGGRARFVDAILPTLRTVRNPVLRDGYLQTLRQVSGVEERVLLESLHRVPDGGRVGGGGPAGSVLDGGRISADSVMASPDAFDPRAILRAITPVERELLRFLLLAPELQVETSEQLAPADLPSTPARELWSAMLAVRAAGPYTSEAVYTRLDPETQALMAALLGGTAVTAPDGGTGRPTAGLAEQGIEQCLLRLELERLEDRDRFTRVELAEAERAADRPAIDRHMTEISHHNENRRALRRRLEQASLLARPVARPAGGRP